MNLCILHIETATPVCSVCLSKNGHVIAEAKAEQAMSHATQLAPLIESLLAEAKLHVSALQAIAVSIGPGSYTGLRIGLSTAKGLAYAAQLPLIGLSSIDALAMAQLHSEPLLVVMDSRKNELYAGLYGSGSKNFEPMPVVLNEEWFQTLPKNLTVCGTGLSKFVDACPNLEPFTINKEVTYEAKHMVALAEKKYKENMFLDLAYARPNYLKPFISKHAS